MTGIFDFVFGLFVCHFSGQTSKYEIPVDDMHFVIVVIDIFLA
ncbi:hypothetical protein SLEP1_g18798 [Rubroshorea leprosula]|uniref:Uncharacterized protein n=1 Tax=Rubroshorea leprosula TaxID=152421 RepID=A0AAV5J9C7_9ROSI|nr:hypothetical protein SLEP1_g18798 [Rubroshorea leprosula]